MCCIQLRTDIGYIYLFNVYMPNNTVNNINLHEYNELLSDVSLFLKTHDVTYCIVGGDLYHVTQFYEMSKRMHPLISIYKLWKGVFYQLRIYLGKNSVSEN